MTSYNLEKVIVKTLSLQSITEPVACDVVLWLICIGRLCDSVKNVDTPSTTASLLHELLHVGRIFTDECLHIVTANSRFDILSITWIDHV